MIDVMVDASDLHTDKTQSGYSPSIHKSAYGMRVQKVWFMERFANYVSINKIVSLRKCSFQLDLDLATIRGLSHILDKSGIDI